MNRSEANPTEKMPELSPTAWQWPLFGYSFAAALILILFTPAAAGRWLAAASAGVQADCGIVLPAFVAVVCYSGYCITLLIKNKLTTLESDRLQVAEHIAYSSGLLGAIFRLVALSHNSEGTPAAGILLGTLAPFKIGFSLWVGVVIIRWLAEHIVMMKRKVPTHEN